MDTALDDFLKRYGDPNNPLRKKQKPLDLNSNGLIGLNNEIGSADISKSIEGDISSLSKEGLTDASKGSAIAGAASSAIGMVPDAMSLVSNFKGDQFNTDPNFAKPGEGRGEILQGAMTGANLGSQFGPIGTGIGLLAGATSSVVGLHKAKKEWAKNDVKQNLNLNEIEKMKRREEYQQSEGLEAIKNLKLLRQKQLGL